MPFHTKAEKRKNIASPSRGRAVKKAALSAGKTAAKIVEKKPRRRK